MHILVNTLLLLLLKLVSFNFLVGNGVPINFVESIPVRQRVPKYMYIFLLYKRIVSEICLLYRFYTLTIFTFSNDVSL